MLGQSVPPQLPPQLSNQPLCRAGMSPTRVNGAAVAISAAAPSPVANSTEPPTSATRLGPPRRAVLISTVGSSASATGALSTATLRHAVTARSVPIGLRSGTRPPVASTSAAMAQSPATFSGAAILAEAIAAEHRQHRQRQHRPAALRAEPSGQGERQQRHAKPQDDAAFPHRTQRGRCAPPGPGPGADHGQLRGRQRDQLHPQPAQFDAAEHPGQDSSATWVTSADSR